MTVIEWDEYCEAFSGVGVQILATAQDEQFLSRAVNSFTALPSTVFGDAEGGIVRWLSKEETPDNHLGAIVQLWITGTNEKAREKLYDRLGRRMRQGILVVPTTAVFNAMPMEGDGEFDVMNNVGHCGDGYEEVIEVYGKKMISVPIMMGYDFLVEEKISYIKGIMGGNLWLFCDSVDSGIKVGRKAVEIFAEIDNVCTTFDVCSAGSKPVPSDAKYPEIGPPTNHYFCPTLKDKLSPGEYKVPEGCKSIPEIVFNALDLDSIKKAMKRVINELDGMEGLQKISTGNYGGKLGKYKIYLNDLKNLKTTNI